MENTRRNVQNILNSGYDIINTYNPDEDGMYGNGKMIELQGEGFMDWMKNLKNVILNPSKSLSVVPKEVKDFLAKYGTYRITNINVCREPLSDKIIKAADLVTSGKFSMNVKSLNYDDVFHLYMKLQITAPTGGDVYDVLLERNQRVNILISNKTVKKGGMCMPVVVDKVIDLNTFVMTNVNDSTWIYNAISNNCQNYVIDRLKSNGLLKPELEKFVSQDVEKLLPNKIIQSIVKGTTNIANLLENVWKGGKIDKSRLKNKNNIYNNINISMFSLKELKAKCKEIGLKNYSKLKKAELVDLINLTAKPIVVEPVVETAVESIVEPVVKAKKPKKIKAVSSEINIETGPVVLDFNDSVSIGRKLKKKASK